jgi:K+-transporting ATPase ATPase C chain
VILGDKFVFAHIRSNLLLLVLTVLLCCVAYPLILLGIGKAIFPAQAEGSLVTRKGDDGKERLIGSRLISQPFAADEYFWPRPSAASFNATASGGSNWGANNPKLRDRAAQQLGPMVKYRQDGPWKDRSVQKDIEAWFAEKPDRAATWADANPTLAGVWATTDRSGDEYGPNGKYVAQWAKDRPAILAGWKKDHPDATEGPKPEDIVGAFFADYSKVHPGTWPDVVEEKSTDGSVTKKIQPVKEGASIQKVFLDPWLQEHADAAHALEPVPADMVTASGSGLDPHITLRNALSVYQLDRVAEKRKASRDQVRKLAEEMAFTPLSGLVGEPLVNVLELNLALDEKFPLPK